MGMPIFHVFVKNSITVSLTLFSGIKNILLVKKRLLFSGALTIIPAHNTLIFCQQEKHLDSGANADS